MNKIDENNDDGDYYADTGDDVIIGGERVIVAILDCQVGLLMKTGSSCSSGEK